MQFKVIRPLAWGVLVLGLTGCSGYYTGGVGVLNNSQKQAVAEYNKMKALRESRVNRGEVSTNYAASGRDMTLVSYPRPVEQFSASNGQWHGSSPMSQSAKGSHPSQHAQSSPAARHSSIQAVAFNDLPQAPAYHAATNNVNPRGNFADSGVLGLYGQMPASSQGRVSPLDSPGNIQRVSFTNEGSDFDPTVDPSGQLIAYASTRHREQSDIYIKRVNGAAVTQLTNDPAADMMPAFSPDGSKIAFASKRSGNWDIYLMESRGGQAIKLTSDPAHDIHPSFSPDGKHLVYCSLSQSSGQWELVVIELAAPSTKKYIGHGLLPNWSPTDNRIVFQRARQRGTRWFSVWTLTFENGEAHSPTELAAADNAAVITPDWSPDGTRVVFCTVIDPQYDDGQSPTFSDLWVMDSDGNNRSKLTHGQYTNLQPVWARDGAIYFISNRAQQGIENVYGIRADQAMRVADSTGRTAPANADTNTATAEVPTD